jgi:PAS domain S-box-containing protein
MSAAPDSNRSDERLLALLQHSFDVILLADAAGQIQYVSPAIERVLGFRPDEFVGRNGFDQLHSDDVGGVRKRFEEVLEQPMRSVSIDCRARHKDGSWRWSESRVTNLLDNPAIRAVVSNFRDISERKAFEHQLQEQQEFWRVALSSIGDAVIVTDAAGQVTFLNAVAASLCGWTADEATGEPLKKVFHIINEKTRKVVESPVEKVIAHGCIVGLANHTVLLTRDGRETAIDDSAAPIFNDAGQISGVVLVFRDVSEKRKSEQLKQHLAAIVESSEDIIVSKTLDGIITSWNKGAEHALRYKPEEVIGKHVSILIPPEQAEDTERILGSIHRGERVEHYRSKRRRKDGGIIDVSITVSPIHDEEGEIIGASKVGRDITHQKKLEQEIEESNRRKDEFLAMLAHELRNPIAAIHGASQLLGTRGSEQDLRWAQEVIQRQVGNLSRLIDDLLDASRITRGKIALRKQVVDLAPIVTSALEIVRPLIEDRRHELNVSLAAGELRLEADPLRLEQILVNLLTNSAKYTDSGGRIFLMAAYEQDEIVIKLEDTGIGIEPKMLPRIFELFAQGDRTIDRAEGGLGIGLTIVERLVEMHGGSVTAHSEGLGKGSKFTVRLPAAFHGRTIHQESPIQSKFSRTPLRVLVVDDNHDMVSGLARLLRMQGHDVQVAYDGQTAIELASEIRPDVILLDIGLPGMSGYEVVRRLRTDTALRNILFIAISGYGQDEDIRKAKEAGFDNHLVKPINYHTLMEVLGRR